MREVSGGVARDSLNHRLMGWQASGLRVSRLEMEVATELGDEGRCLVI